jgi:hypothetical protein
MAVVGVPIAIHQWHRQTMPELWLIAGAVGLIGTLAIPSIVTH